MASPKISWYVYDQDEYVLDNDFHLGSFNSKSTIKIKIQIWNNRYGSSDVDTIDNASLVVYFDSLEDSALLNYCTLAINDNVNEEEILTPEIENNKAYFLIGKLSGQANDGIIDLETYDNYKNITLTFSDFDYSLKNGLKNLYLDIELN